MKHFDPSNASNLLDVTLQLIKQGDEQIIVNDDSFIIVCGDTGSGKSTLINYLIGEQLEAFKPINSRKLCIDTVNPSVDIKIGHSKTSETLIPNNAKDSVNGIVYWDCPGFDDSRGPAIDIANSFYINKLFSGQNIKILMVIDESSLTGPKRGQAFKELVFRLSELFVNQEELIDCLSIVFTKSRDIENYREELSIFVDDTKDSLKEEEFVLLKKIIEKVPISYFDLPLKAGYITTEQSMDIIQEIQKSEYITSPEVNITVSTNSLMAVQGLITFTSKQIGKISKTIARKLESQITEEDNLDKLKEIRDKFTKLINHNSPAKKENIDQMEEIALLMQNKAADSILDNNLNDDFAELKQLVRYFEDFYAKIIPDSAIEDAKLKGPFCLTLMHKLEVVINQITYRENEEQLKEAMKEVEEKQKIYQEELEKKDQKINAMLEEKELQIQFITQQLEEEKKGRVNFEQLLSQQQNLINNLNGKIAELEASGGNSEMIEALSKQMLELTNQVIELQNRPVQVQEIHHHHEHNDGGLCEIM